MDLRIRNLRRRLDWTQEELANKVNSTSSNISKYEAGAREPSLDTLILLAKTFDVTVDYLIGYSDVPNPYIQNKNVKYSNIAQNNSVIYDSAAYEVIKRHVDFLLCEYLSEGRNSRYVPLMAIEVRGKNHDLDLYVQKNDDFKERLFKQLDFPLCIIKNEDVKKVSVIDFSENLFQLLQNELKNKMSIGAEE
ncbi:hypothetical protein FACS1894188_00710 [Clostridia bacterium]|nr:hypothetical protein FACS1894188_00710 [Clostridia bacterium]